MQPMQIYLLCHVRVVVLLPQSFLCSLLVCLFVESPELVALHRMRRRDAHPGPVLVGKPKLLALSSVAGGRIKLVHELAIPDCVLPDLIISVL